VQTFIREDDSDARASPLRSPRAKDRASPRFKSLKFSRHREANRGSAWCTLTTLLLM